MPMPLLALRPKHPSDGVTLCASAMRAAAGAEAPPFPVRRHLFPSLIRLLLVGILVGGHLAPPHAQSAVAPSGMLGPLPPIDCSTETCDSLDQRPLLGRQMFDEQNFATIVDGFGRARQFYVHIPATYDAVDGETQKIPLIFAFHGGGSQTPEAMITGKWEEYFDQDYAFAIPLAGADPCENPGGNGKSHWMQAGMAFRTSPADPNCDPATAVVNGAGVTRTYWNTSLPATFTDVLFVEELRAMLLARFPKLNAEQGIRHRVLVRGRDDLHAGVLPRVAVPRLQRGRQDARQRQRSRRL